MCLALYLGADHPLPLIPYPELAEGAMDSPTWPLEAPRFHVAPLSPEQEVVRRHFRVEHLVYAGSYEECGCGFQYGREFPIAETCERELRAAAESVAALVEYVREHRVRELFTCWHGEEADLVTQERGFPIDRLAAPDFHFRQGEWIELVMELA